MKSLKAFGMGVMSLVAASSLVVSCYDDSFLREEISDVKDDLKGLTARLDSLEKSLTSQITAVQALYTAVASLEAADDELTSKDEELASKIIIAEVKATDNGKIQVVLTDGTSVEIEPASNVKNQLVTVVDKNWALVDPVTGAVTTLKVNDATVPVSHPGFKIRFNDNTITGKFTHEKPIIESDGGHGMLFRDKEELMLTYHSPNQTDYERPVFVKLNELK
jgi:hypothetical protein